MFNGLVLAMWPELQPVTAYYETFVLFTNCFTCLQEYSAVESQFVMQSSTLEAYLDKL
jgi:hypothetical protein